MLCRRCDYILTGLVAGPCPECGRPFDPGDDRSFAMATRANRARMPLLLIVLGTLVGIVLIYRITFFFA